ncbi:hypothetical protein EDC01DRAFT_776029 [Geopyxis carbonaria]|nr:hypothetical protein EDC01DRAFT_776029 [Geopyxis carbonaria]
MAPLAGPPTLSEINATLALAALLLTAFFGALIYMIYAYIKASPRVQHPARLSPATETGHINTTGLYNADPSKDENPFADPTPAASSSFTQDVEAANSERALVRAPPPAARPRTQRQKPTRKKPVRGEGWFSEHEDDDVHRWAKIAIHGVTGRRPRR